MNIQRFAPIGVIDSGIGGLSLLKNLVKKYSAENYIYLADNLHMPYGNKSKTWIIDRIGELINYLYDNFNVKLIVLACNTASSCLEQINKISPVKVIGLDLKSCIVDDYNILCTKLTAKNYSGLNTYPCNRLAEYIEDNIFDQKALGRYIKRVINKADIAEQNIILGCTHYELILKHFKAILPNKNYILPCDKFVLDLTLNKPNISNIKGDILMISTLSTKSYIDKLWKIFKA
ncbi:MAG: glutamate racemase [Clostridia bacterium]